MTSRRPARARPLLPEQSWAATAKHAPVLATVLAVIAPVATVVATVFTPVAAVVATV
ncbi:MAG: hypothetical protein ACTHQQ_22810 [Solirubrobacteraceae bacterium]